MGSVSMWSNRSVRSLSSVPVDIFSIRRAYANVDSAPNRYTNAMLTSVFTKPESSASSTRPVEAKLLASGVR